ncbi:MAG: tail fiber domain-containing protein [Thermoanaerobaculia bacterium]
MNTRELSHRLTVGLALLFAGSRLLTADIIQTPALVQGRFELFLGEVFKPEVVLDTVDLDGPVDNIAISTNGFVFDIERVGSSPFLSAENAAPGHSLFIESSGDIGLGTTTPTQDLHVAGGEIQLNPTGTDDSWRLNPGPQGLWFRHNDSTGTVSVKFQEDSPTDSLVVAQGGVGVGTALPAEKLHVSGGDAKISDTEVELILDDTDTTGDDFTLRTTAATGGQEFVIEDGGVSTTIPFRIATGSLDDAVVIDSTGVTLSSSRAVKANIEPAVPSVPLADLATLPIYTWSYASDARGATHIGPMAEDFYHRFGFGRDERRISSIDTAGVALAAIQALRRKLEERYAELAELKATVQLLLAERGE